MSSKYADLIEKLEEIAVLYMKEHDLENGGVKVTFPPIVLTFRADPSLQPNSNHLFELEIGFGEDTSFFEDYDLEKLLNDVTG